MKKQIRIYIYIIGLILIDQLSKVWALSALRGTEGIVVIPNVFELSYLENRGAAFGILQDHQIFFVLITVAAAVILTWIYRRIPQTKKYIPLRISYALIMAGAFGNLIDRVFRGYVVDFFYFKWIDFPVFNVADIYVTVTMILLLILICADFFTDFSVIKRKVKVTVPDVFEIVSRCIFNVHIRFVKAHGYAFAVGNTVKRTVVLRFPTKALTAVESLRKVKVMHIGYFDFVVEFNTFHDFHRRNFLNKVYHIRENYDILYLKLKMENECREDSLFVKQISVPTVFQTGTH